MEPKEIINALTERFKDSANVRLVFGEVIESEGDVSLIPVATIKVSGGGGVGKPKRRQGEEGGLQDKEVTGMGLGLSIAAKPIGYIEIKEDSARFVPITDTTKVAVGGMVVASLLLLTVNRIISLKAHKKHRQALWKAQHHFQRMSHGGQQPL